MSIQYDKLTLRQLTPENWVYTGYDEPYYLFQTGDYSTGFKEIRACDDDITRSNLKFMADNNLTR